MFVAGWRHALRSEWPFIIIISVSTPPSAACPQVDKLTALFKQATTLALVDARGASLAWLQLAQPSMDAGLTAVLVNPKMCILPYA